MTYLLIPALASLVVRYWPGARPSAWVPKWIDRLWMVFGLTFLLGFVLLFFNETKVPLQNGGMLYSFATPAPVQYALHAIAISLLVVTVAGAASIGAAEIAHYMRSTGTGDLARAARARLWKFAAGLTLAAAAFVVSVVFSGPLVTTNAGHSNLVPFGLGMISLVVFVTALSYAWTAAKLHPTES